jgi:hypothetical protein
MKCQKLADLLTSKERIVEAALHLAAIFKGTSTFGLRISQVDQWHLGSSIGVYGELLCRP